VQVQALIGASNAAAFDLTAACSGFVLALVTGTQYIRTGTFKNILIIGGDALSRFTDWRDRCRFLQRLHRAHVWCSSMSDHARDQKPREATCSATCSARLCHHPCVYQSHMLVLLSVCKLYMLAQLNLMCIPSESIIWLQQHDKRWYFSMHWQPGYCDIWCMLVAPAATCILFGDGCGAVVLSAAPEGESCSLLGMSMHSDGKGQKSLNAMYGGSGGKHTEDSSASGQASYRNISMAGQEVFKFAVRSVPQVRVLPAPGLCITSLSNPVPGAVACYNSSTAALCCMLMSDLHCWGTTEVLGDVG
jgi:hypothetical protein